MLLAKQAIPISLQVLKNNTSRYTKSEINARTKAENSLKVAKNNLKPPKWLGKIAREEFKYIVKETADIELINNLDVHNLAMYCNSYEQYILMSEKITKDGYMVEANKSSETVVAAHPLLLRQNQLLDQLRKLQGDLGLNPSSRAKIAIAKAQENTPKDHIAERFGEI